MRSERIVIQCSSRLHLSLFSMHDTGLRANGGIGFAIESPSVTVSATPSEEFVVSDNRKYGLSKEGKDRLVLSLAKASSLYSLKDNISIDISGDALANHGFGSGTAIRLSSLEALMKLNSVELSDSELVRLSGRGGTSGIGINTYFSGGVILDLGVKNNNRIHLPSSCVGGNPLPLVLSKEVMPLWEIGICIPENIPPLTHDQEIKFFKETCPINEVDAFEALYHSVAGVFASIRENDKGGFEYSIRELQKCEWKKAEREIHGRNLVDIENALYDLGATAVGMSSLGPSLYFLSDDVSVVESRAKRKLPCCALFKTIPSNYGRTIKC